MSTFQLFIGTRSVIPVFAGELPVWLFAQAAKFVAEETSRRCTLSEGFAIKAAPDDLGKGAEALALFLRAYDYDVLVRATPTLSVRHVLCGRVFRGEAWKQRPTQRQPDKVDQLDSFIETRECDCGSSITYASMRVELL